MALVRATFWAVCVVRAHSLSMGSSVGPDGSDPLSDASEPNNVGLSQPVERIGLRLGPDERSELILAVANSIRKLSRFVAQEAAAGNDDLFFTLRMAQGQLYQLSRDNPSLYADHELGVLLTAADADLASAGEVLEQNFQFSQHLGEEFQALMDPARGRTMVRIDPSPTIPDFGKKWQAAFQENFASAGTIIEFKPSSSDRCLAQVSPVNLTYLETAITGRSSYCPVDAPCWLMMTKPGATGYYLNHQVMFLALGGTTGCGPDFERHARNYFANWLPSYVDPIAPEIMRFQCGDVLQEAKSNVAIGLPEEKRDIFLEEGFLCGASVFMPQFFNSSWVRSVLSWQKPSGCFGFFDNRTYVHDNARIERGSPEAVEEFRVPEGGREEEHVGPSARREKPMGGIATHTTQAWPWVTSALPYGTSQTDASNKHRVESN